MANQKKRSHDDSKKGKTNKKRKKEILTPLFSFEQDARLFATVLKESVNTSHCMIDGCRYKENCTPQEYANHILKHISFFKCQTCQNELCGLSDQQAREHHCADGQCSNPRIMRNNDALKVLERARAKINENKLEELDKQLGNRGWGLSESQRVFLDMAIKNKNNTCKACLWEKKFTKIESLKKHVIAYHMVGIYKCAICGIVLTGNSKEDASKKLSPCKLNGSVISGCHIVETVSLSQERIMELAKQFDIEKEFNTWQVRMDYLKSHNQMNILNNLYQVSYYRPINNNPIVERHHAPPTPANRLESSLSTIENYNDASIPVDVETFVGNFLA